MSDPPNYQCQICGRGKKIPASWYQNRRIHREKLYIEQNLERSFHAYMNAKI